jgi:hypothetical protein
MGMEALADLAQRLDAAVEAMVDLGPALAAGEPWPLTNVYAPGPESSWGPREVLAHVSEMLPYWLGEIERILDGGVAPGGGEPPAFGRLEEDAIRVQVIGRDRNFPARELLARIDVEGRRVAARLRALERDAALLGRHPTRGDLSIADVAERMIVGHAEGHLVQLRESIRPAR